MGRKRAKPARGGTSRLIGPGTAPCRPVLGPRHTTIDYSALVAYLARILLTCYAYFPYHPWGALQLALATPGTSISPPVHPCDHLLAPGSVHSLHTLLSCSKIARTQSIATPRCDVMRRWSLPHATRPIRFMSIAHRSRRIHDSDTILPQQLTTRFEEFVADYAESGRASADRGA